MQYFLVFMIFTAVRAVMLQAGLVIIHIPLLDSVLWPVLGLMNDPEQFYAAQLWLRDLYYSWTM